MTPAASQSRYRVLGAAAAVLSAYGAGIYIVFLWIPDAWLSARLRLPFAVFLVQAAVLAILTVSICLVKIKSQLRNLRASSRRDAIQQAVAVLAAGERSQLKLDLGWIDYPEDLAPHLEIMLSTTKGEAFQRLSRLVSEVGLTAHWVRETRRSGTVRRRNAVRLLSLIDGYTVMDRLKSMISDSDPAVRVCVYRALLKLGRRAEDVELVFHAIADEPLLNRALLNNELAKHATHLSVQILSDELAASGPERRIRLLDMVLGWRRMVNIQGMRELLLVPNPDVQQRLLALLPYLAGEGEADEQAKTQSAQVAAVLSALESGNENVKVAAAAVCGRLRLESAIPVLARGLKEPRHRVARTFAHALAELGPPGVCALETEVLSFSSRSASLALEALESVVPGRLADA